MGLGEPEVEEKVTSDPPEKRGAWPEMGPLGLWKGPWESVHRCSWAEAAR